MKFRYGHSCASIHTDETSLQFSVIVAGGTYNPSVEILDQGATLWRDGPELPIDVDFGAMVEDPLGQ